MSSNSLKKFSIPIFILILNLVIKSWYLGAGDVAMDEPFTIFYAQADLATLFNMLKTENNPPLFFLILHFWIKIFGISAISVRFLPMVFSSISAVVIYFTGKKFFSSLTGVVAALLFTFSDYHLLLAHEARVYSLFALLTSISMFYFLSLVEPSNLKRNIYGLIISNLLLIYAHFFGFFVLAIQVLCVLILPRLRKEFLRMYALILLITLVPYIPYLVIFISRFIISVGGTWVPHPQLSDLYNMVWKFSNAPVITVFFVLLLCISAISYFIRRRSENNPSVFEVVLIIWFLFPYIFIFLVSFIVPMFLDRYLVFVSIAYYLLVSLAIRSLGWRRWFLIFLTTLSVGMMFLTFNPNVDNKRRIKEVAETVRKMKKEGSVILICPEWLDKGFVYYYNREYFMDYRKMKSHLSDEKIYPVNMLVGVDTVMLKNAADVIYLEEWATLTDKDNQIYRYLDNHFGKKETVKIFETFTVHHFINRVLVR